MLKGKGTGAAEEDRTRREFAELIKPHEHTLYVGALRFTNNATDAEDLLQETFMRGYVGYKRSQGIEQPRAWLFKIMTNAYINRYHKKRRRPAAISYEDTLDHKLDNVYAPTNEDPQERFFAQFLDSEVKEAIESLPEHFRRSVILCDISGLTYNEISEVLDCSLGTVRSRISRGRELLFNRLYDYAVERGIVNSGTGRRRRRREKVRA
jgi:RNA polymerase sigma-70 factor (ECF subfamily)